MVSECSVRGRVLALLEDGVPRSVSSVAAELGLGVRSVLWTLYDLHRLGLVLRSVKPVGVLPVQLAGRDVALKESAYCIASDAAVDGAVIRGVRYVKWKNRIDGGSNRKIQGTIQSRVMRLLSNGGPRSIKEIAGQLGLGEESTYNAVYLLYKRGALLRSEKPRAQQDTNRWAKEEARHLWTPRTNGEGSCFVNGETFIEHKPRPSKSLSQSIIEYVREYLHDRAAFTTDLRTKLEERLGTKIPQSMVMYVLGKYRRREVYVRGYQSADKMTPFEQGFAVTWIDPNLPREQALAEAKERTDKLLQDEQTTSPLFERVHSIFDIVTDVSLKRDIAGQIYIMSELACSRHQLELALEKTLQLHPMIKRVSIFGDANGDYGYPHFYNERVLSYKSYLSCIYTQEGYEV